MCKERGADEDTIWYGTAGKSNMLMIKKSYDFIRYPRSTQLSVYFPIPDSLIYFRHSRTDPGEKGAGQTRVSL